jgi:hypothetical protein
MIVTLVALNAYQSRHCYSIKQKKPVLPAFSVYVYIMEYQFICRALATWL